MTGSSAPLQLHQTNETSSKKHKARLRRCLVIVDRKTSARIAAVIILLLVGILADAPRVLNATIPVVDIRVDDPLIVPDNDQISRARCCFSGKRAAPRQHNVIVDYDNIAVDGRAVSR